VTVAKILVADDNRQFVDMLRATLEDAGFEVVTAYSGLAAASMVERDDDVDLLVLDVLMPGMSGDAVAELLHGLKPDLPVLLMTGDSGDQFVHTAGLPRLHKPFAEQELVRTVGELLGTG
jgi:CheY-like chemotaxis protein